MRCSFVRYSAISCASAHYMLNYVDTFAQMLRAAGGQDLFGHVGKGKTQGRRPLAEGLRGGWFAREGLPAKRGGWLVAAQWPPLHALCGWVASPMPRERLPVCGRIWNAPLRCDGLLPYYIYIEKPPRPEAWCCGRGGSGAYLLQIRPIRLGRPRESAGI